MERINVSLSDAAHMWVDSFNAIPQSVVEKLMKLNCDDVNEITPPSRRDRVYVFNGEYDGVYGEILSVSEDDDEVYLVELDGKDEAVEIKQEDFELERDDILPMWGTMWSFGDSCDEWWIKNKEGLQKMADCGFRIYENEDFGYIFGIDGAGYNFYEAHWMPLYKARGLQWHDTALSEEIHTK